MAAVANPSDRTEVDRVLRIPSEEQWPHFRRIGAIPQAEVHRRQDHPAPGPMAQRLL
jgi:hypothetical protein